MRCISPEKRRKLYLYIIKKNGEIKFEDLQKMIWFEGHHKTSQLKSMLRGVEGAYLKDGTVRIDTNKCPQWVRYFMHLKQNGECDVIEMAEKFNTKPCNVFNALMLHDKYLNKRSESGRYLFALKETLI